MSSGIPHSTGLAELLSALSRYVTTSNLSVDTVLAGLSQLYHENPESRDGAHHAIGASIELVDSPGMLPSGLRRFEVNDVVRPWPGSAEWTYVVRPIGGTSDVRIPAQVVQAAPPFPPIVTGERIGHRIVVRTAVEAEAVAVELSARIQVHESADAAAVKSATPSRNDFFTCATALAAWAQVAPDQLISRLEAKAAPLAAERIWAAQGRLLYPPGADIQCHSHAGPPLGGLVTAVHSGDQPTLTCEIQLWREDRPRVVPATSLGPAAPFPAVTVHRGTFRTRGSAEQALVDAAALLRSPHALHSTCDPEPGSHLVLQFDVDALAGHLARWLAPGELTAAGMLEKVRPAVERRTAELHHAMSASTSALAMPQQLSSVDADDIAAFAAADFPAGLRLRREPRTGAEAGRPGTGAATPFQPDGTPPRPGRGEDPGSTRRSPRR